MSFIIQKSFYWLASLFYRGTKGALSPACLCNRTRSIFDELHCIHRIDKDENILYGELETEEVKPHIRTVVHFLNESIQINCLAPDQQLPGNKLSDALQLCNRWNYREFYPMVFIDPYTNRFITEYSICVDACSNNKFLKEKIIAPVLTKNLEFFKETNEFFTKK